MSRSTSNTPRSTSRTPSPRPARTRSRPAIRTCRASTRPAPSPSDRTRLDARRSRARHRLRLRRAALRRLGALRPRAAGLGRAHSRRAVDVRGDGDRHRRLHRRARRSRRSTATAPRPTAARSSSPARPAASAVSPWTCSRRRLSRGREDGQARSARLAAERSARREILPREAVSLANDAKPRPLLPARWAGALDNVGGATLEALVRGDADRRQRRAVRPGRRRDYRGTRDAVHPARRRPARHHLLEHADAGAPAPVGAARDRSASASSRRRSRARVALDALPGEIDRMLAGQAFGRVVVPIG